MRHGLSPLCFLVLGIIGFGCGGADEPADSNATRSIAPSLGAADSLDSADYSCQIVLRNATRRIDNGRFITRCVEDVCSWAWRVTADVRNDSLEGASPELLYTAVDGSWLSVSGDAIAGAEVGYTRFGFDVFEGTLSPSSTSTTGLERYELKMIPYLQTQDGRVFDHNRIVDPVQSYVLNAANSLTVLDDPQACSDTPTAVIQFDAKWNSTVTGELKAGSSVAVVYDQNRSTQCRSTHNGNPAWSLEAFVRFAPFEEVLSQPVIGFNATFGSLADSISPRFEVPAGATGMEVWFKNASYAGGACESYDSNFGRNYRFDVQRIAAADWQGNTTFTISRGASTPCDSGVDVAGGFSFDTWARSRAAVTSICTEVYAAGVTDRDGGDVFEVGLETRFDGTQEWTSIPMDFVGRSGNNSRYSTSLRGVDPFSPYGAPCPEFGVERDEQYMWIGADFRIVLNGTVSQDIFRGSFSQYLNPTCFQ